MSFKKALLAFCFSIFINLSYGENLQQYYADINAAELAITRSDYQKAADFYKAAFAQKEEPFAQDIYNESVCYIKLNEPEKSMTACKLLAERGIGDSFFLKHEVYQPLHKLPEWTGLLQLAKSRKRSLDKKNKVLLCRLKDLYNQDQRLHGFLHDYYSNVYGGHDDKATDSLIDNFLHQEDSVIAEKLKTFFQKNNDNRILSEFDLGPFLNEETNIISDPGFYVIILHNYQGVRQYDSLFEPFLKKAIVDGKIKPLVYASMKDGNPQNNTSQYYGTTGMYILIGKNLYVNKYANSQDRKAYINHKRAEIMLPSVDDYKEKIIYNIEHKNTDFNITTYITRYGSFYNEKSKTQILKSLDLVQGGL